jgi:hypothetical protein
MSIDRFSTPFLLSRSKNQYHHPFHLNQNKPSQITSLHHFLLMLSIFSYSTPFYILFHSHTFIYIHSMSWNLLKLLKSSNSTFVYNECRIIRRLNFVHSVSSFDVTQRYPIIITTMSHQRLSRR